MKKLIGLVLLVLITSIVRPSSAQVPSPYEYAIVNWHPPDRIFENLPGKFEMVTLRQLGVTVPRDAQTEEFCLSVAANLMAKQGWEPINLSSRRILFRRLVGRH